MLEEPKRQYPKNERSLENRLAFYLDCYHISYEREPKEFGYFDFLVKLRDKQYIVEVKQISNTRAITEIVMRVIHKYKSLPQKTDGLYILVPISLELPNIRRLCEKYSVSVKVVNLETLLEEFGCAESSIELTDETFINKYHLYEPYLNEIKNDNNKKDNSPEEYIEQLQNKLEESGISAKEPFSDYFQFSDSIKKRLREKILSQGSDGTTGGGSVDAMLGIGGTRDKIIILEADIKNYSTMVRVYGAEIIVERIRNYYDSVTSLCQKKYDIFLDKFIGDAVLVAFNYPFHDDKHFLEAINFSFELVGLCDKFFSDLNIIKDEQIETGIRVGIAYGSLYVINSRLREITFIGDKINLAARLESKSEVNGVLVSNEFFEEFKAKPNFEDFKQKYSYTEKVLDKKDVKGQLADIKAYQIVKKSDCENVAENTTDRVQLEISIENI